MTTVANTMSTNEFWKKISYNPSSYFDEFSLNLVNEVLAEDADHFEKITALINEESEDDSPISDEVDQRPLQATSSNSPPIESQPLLNLVCGVCSAPAHGYNFDQITCESCKAFFRRNALRNTAYLRCRFSGSCTINIHTRRQCTYCRLKKCFDINMRKDWIRTDEERELRKLRNIQKQQRKMNKTTTNEQPIINLPIVMRKKKRIQQSTAKPVIQELVVRKVEPISRIHRFGIHRNLLESDKILLNNIQNAYKYGSDQANYNHISHYTSDSSLTQFLNDETVNHQSLIYFYKHVSEFRQFDLADQILLIKCNMVDLIHLHHVITQNFQELPQMAEHMSHWVGPNFHKQMSRTRSRFDCFMKYPLVLKISLIVFVFSINLSTPRGSSQFSNYTNKKKLCQNQNYYLEILWRYLVYLFGETEAIRSMQVIVMQILRYQTLMNTMDEALREKNAHQNIFDPLMQSIFGLT